MVVKARGDFNGDHIVDPCVGTDFVELTSVAR